MKLSNFNYKPRNITQITRKDFEDCGFDFRKFVSELLYSKFPESKPLPDFIQLDVAFAKMDLGRRLGQFGFLTRNSKSDSCKHFSLTLYFPEYNTNYEVSRNVEDAFSGLPTRFPNSAETIGGAFGNFHVRASISDLYCNTSKSLITFDEEGNYLPLIYHDLRHHDMHIDEVYPALRYTPEEVNNPTDLDKMFIPELSDVMFGIYAFWLDPKHIAFVKDINKMGYDMSRDCDEEAINVFTSLSDNGLKDFQEPILHHSKRFRRSDRLYYNFDGMFRYYKSEMTQLTDIHSIRAIADPNLSKALEIFEIVNSEPEKFIKKAIFADSYKKLSAAISPLVSLTSQIIRSCKSFQMEEI